MPEKRRETHGDGASGSRGRWPLILVLAVTAVLLVVVVIRLTDDDDEERAAAPAGVSHVHGLGINPDDGQLYAATHHGVFRIPDEGTAELVSVPRDTMGFTVVGADHFLGSGHPAFQGDPLLDRARPPLLGLIESTDGGRTWEPRSLFGEVDFHALAAAHGNVYGFDATSGRFLVSSDGETWDTRSENLAMSDFAVDPAAADRVVAATDGGLIESEDGGRTWTSIEGPPVVLLSWDAERGLWGASGDGRIFTRRGTSWTERGRLPGPPQALLVAQDGLYAAASDGERTGIYVSADDGRSWQLRYADEP